MALSVTDLANLALDELPAQQIGSISDETHRAEVCRRQFPRAVGLLLEKEWSFQIRRAPLVATTNTRGTQWGYAYATPSDMGYPLRLRSSAGWGPLGWDAGSGLAYDIEGGSIWSNDLDVTLEYVSSAADFATMTASFQEALIWALAARICLPITKDEAKRDKLYQKAELFRDRALAADANRTSGGNRYGDFLPDVLAAGLDLYPDAPSHGIGKAITGQELGNTGTLPNPVPTNFDFTTMDD